MLIEIDSSVVWYIDLGVPKTQNLFTKEIQERKTNIFFRLYFIFWDLNLSIIWRSRGCFSNRNNAAKSDFQVPKYEK